MRRFVGGFATLFVFVGMAAYGANQPTDPDETVVLRLDDGIIVIRLNCTFALQQTLQRRNEERQLLTQTYHLG